MKHETVCDRRTFLRRVAMLGGGAALLLGGARPAATVGPREAQPGKETARGYRVTAQVRQYYRTARA